MKNKRTLILLLELLLVVGSVAGMIFYMESQQATVDVFIYTKNITDDNHILSESDIKMVSVPKIATNEKFVFEKEDIIGKFINTNVNSGQYVYLNQLISEGEKDIFEVMDLEEYRMISLPIDLVSGLSGNIKRGDVVDLVFTGRAQKQGEDMYSNSEFMYSKTFMQGVLVYSVNTKEGFLFEDQSTLKDGDLKDEEGQTTEGSSLGIITLAVKLNEVEEINARLKVGDITFVGRFNDSTDSETVGYVIGNHGPVFSGEASVEVNNYEEFLTGELPEEQPVPEVEVVEEVTEGE